MRLTIEEIAAEQEEELILRCHEVSADTLAFLQRFVNRRKGLVGYKGDEIHKIAPEDVFYFEVVDNRSFFYCEKEVYETKLKLYEFEALCRDTPLFRASKSLIINSANIDYITPSFSGRFEVTFCNGEKVIVSRQYVGELKKRMGL